MFSSVGPSRMLHRLILSAGFLCLVMLAAGCGPSLSPLYRDYEVGAHQQALEARIEAALQADGWKLAEASAPNVIATEERQVKHWGLYKVMVSLEAVPVGEDHVRLYLHPYRHYVTGSRSKLPFLNKGLQRALLSDLNDAFDRYGLQPIGTTLQRDEAMTSR